MKTKISKINVNSNAAQKILAFSGLVVLIIVFSIASPYFFTFSNIKGILLATAVNGVLAIGVTFVIITGGIDLSVGTGMTLSGVMTGVFITKLGMPVPLGVLLGILTGALIGFLNGLGVAKLKLPPFIATLGMMQITKGLSLVISDAKPIYFYNTPSFTKISTASVIGKIIPGFDIPNAVLIMFILAIIGGAILTKTIIGRYTFAIGSNEEATRLSGIKVDSWKILIYTITGIFVGIAGVLMAARLNSAQPALGAGYEMDAIAATVIGGTSLSGGEGTMLGAIIGAFIISVITNGLRILSVPQQWQMVVTGAIVILAVYADILRRRKA